MEEIYDEIVITLIKEGKPNGQIRMEKGSIAALRDSHGISTGDVLENMFQALVEEAKKQKENKDHENS